MGNQAPEDGHEIIPTERAQSLVAYLLSLNNTYDYPESRPIAQPAAKENAPAAEEKKAEGEKK
jgi:cytochrome c oxidase cbb3-type subunit 2